MPGLAAGAAHEGSGQRDGELSPDRGERVFELSLGSDRQRFAVRDVRVSETLRADDLELDLISSLREPLCGGHGDGPAFSAPVDADKDKMAHVGRNRAVIRGDLPRI